jgi:hypothetical protein
MILLLSHSAAAGSLTIADFGGDRPPAASLSEGV